MDVVVNHKFNNPKIFLWYDLLGQFGSPMMRRVIKTLTQVSIKELEDSLTQ